MGQDTTVPDSPLLTRFPRLCEAGTQLHRPKGCWHSSAEPEPAPLASSLSWGRGEMLALHPQGCSGGTGVARLWVLQGRLQADLCFVSSCRVLVLLSQHFHNTQTLRGCLCCICQAGALGHPSHGSSSMEPTQTESSTTPQPSTGAGHCFLWD